MGIALSLVSPNEEHVLQLAEAKLTGGAGRWAGGVGGWLWLH